jgi:hypothetical protein
MAESYGPRIEKLQEKVADLTAAAVAGDQRLKHVESELALLRESDREQREAAAALRAKVADLEGLLAEEKAARLRWENRVWMTLGALVFLLLGAVWGAYEFGARGSRTAPAAKSSEKALPPAAP